LADRRSGTVRAMGHPGSSGAVPRKGKRLTRRRLPSRGAWRLQGSSPLVRHGTRGFLRSRQSHGPAGQL
jgi:hypothetical protein